jgi:hypothetical protein
MNNFKRLFWIIQLLGVHSISIAQTSKSTAKDPAKPFEVVSDKKVEKKSKDYDQIITKDAKSQKGIFLTHKVGDKYYF